MVQQTGMVSAAEIGLQARPRKSQGARLAQRGVYDLALYAFWAMQDTVEERDERWGNTSTWIGSRLRFSLPCCFLGADCWSDDLGEGSEG